MTEGEILIGTNPDSLDSTVLPATPEEKAKQLPEPTGYRILCAIPEVEAKYSNGLLKSDVSMRHEEVLSTVFFVMALGPSCYKDPARFPYKQDPETGEMVPAPWCKVGDFILARPTSGTRLKIHGREFRIMNDDSVEAVVEDPRGISRA
jgi:co-chaperonin GroES (HSP10)